MPSVSRISRFSRQTCSFLLTPSCILFPARDGIAVPLHFPPFPHVSLLTSYYILLTVSMYSSGLLMIYLIAFSFLIDNNDEGKTSSA
jgi:hypothetical protein